VETLVVDASSLIDWLMKEDARSLALDEILEPASLIGPGHLLIEASQSLKNLSRVRPSERIAEAFEALTSMHVTTLDFSDFARLTWHHRHNLSLYDAGYLATAIVSGHPLVTSDRGLAMVAKNYVDVIGPPDSIRDAEGR
jgi:predicted nucleic acid-binding protein